MERLLNEYQVPVYNAALRMLGDRDDAEDTAQAVFLKVFENIGAFDSTHRLFSWIYRIAINESINRIRRRRKFEPFDDERADGGDSTGRQVQAEELEDAVQEALLTLSEEHRAVLVLRYFTDCDYHRISDTLGIPEKTVKSRLFEARRQLRHRLKARGVLPS